VQLYAGTLALAGSYSAYLGYKRADGPLIYIDQPLTVGITQ
jgi:hypothetical protein